MFQHLYWRGRGQVSAIPSYLKGLLNWTLHLNALFSTFVFLFVTSGIWSYGLQNLYLSPNSMCGLFAFSPPPRSWCTLLLLPAGFKCGYFLKVRHVWKKCIANKVVSNTIHLPQTIQSKTCCHLKNFKSMEEKWNPGWWTCVESEACTQTPAKVKICKG